MDKKTKIIVAVVLAVVVVGGLCYGVNRWYQQRLANKILKEVYGVNTGLWGKLTGGDGTIQEQVAKELAKQAAKEEAQQKADEAAEASMTPKDRYNEAEEMSTYDASSTALATGIKDIIEKAFGKAKLTSLSTGIYGSAASGSGVLEFKIARLTTGADLGTLNEVLADKGLPVMQSGISDKTASVMAGSEAAGIYTFSFEIGGQDVGVLIMKNN